MEEEKISTMFRNRLIAGLVLVLIFVLFVGVLAGFPKRVNGAPLLALDQESADCSSLERCGYVVMPADMDVKLVVSFNLRGQSHGETIEQTITLDYYPSLISRPKVVTWKYSGLGGKPLTKVRLQRTEDPSSTLFLARME